MGKHWIVVGCVTMLLVAPGCRSARYRVQRYYKYPPTYVAGPTNAPRAASVTPTAPMSNRPSSPAAPSAVGPAQGAVSGTVAAASASSLSKSKGGQAEKGWWSRLFGQRKTAGGPPVTNPNEDKGAAPIKAPAVAAPRAATETASVGVYRLKLGDPVMVYLRGIPGVPNGEQQIENVVGEDGTIPLPYINNINVLNMTATEAQEAIRRAYVDGQIYKQLTVNVIIPARSYYIRGEVRQPGRYPLVGTVTVLQAIAAAGGYTEFASYDVEIVRGERRLALNMRRVEKKPDLDVAIEPGDIIVVNRSFF